MKRSSALFVVLLPIISMFFLLGMNSDTDVHRTLIFLPGTQPGIVSEVDSVQLCKPCHHSASPTRPVTLYNEWSGSPMANSARDPIFYAALAVANKYEPGAGEFCIRCHAPAGWLIGHSLDHMGRSLVGSDLDGIQCDFCHRLGNPLDPDSTVPPLTFPVPGYGNGMLVFQENKQPKRGPYTDTNYSHASKYEPLQKKSEMCAICHDISNPFYAQDRLTQKPHEYSPLERTYSEWLMSDFPAMGDSGTCQACHMKVIGGYGSIIGSQYRPDLRQHDLTGGNTFLPDILPDFWGNLNPATLQAGKARAESTLSHAASLSLSLEQHIDSIVTTVRVTNLTGHKLPTGYPEGRRMWLHVLALNSGGDTIFQSGRYDTATGTLYKDEQSKVYEMHQGMKDSTAMKYNLTPGESFHFALNDTILLDNRIPPKGFTNEKFKERLAEPRGYSYADSQFWDDTRYVLPPNSKTVEVTLYYQTISKEYIEFLRDENVGNDNDWNEWGSKLYNAWSNRGKSRPVAVASLKQTLTSVNDAGETPTEIVLTQNFPNPFNPVTNFLIRVPVETRLTLKIYDITGREIETVVNAKYQGGEYPVRWDASRYPAGIYFAQVISENFTRTIKLAYIK